ncbi:alkaline phosphatase family protein [Patescibacteria group bacterium]|nr:alkaline phosphatase family protein [Patescibacteria group bacterium]
MNSHIQKIKEIFANIFSKEFFMTNRRKILIASIVFGSAIIIGGIVIIFYSNSVNNSDIGTPFTDETSSITGPKLLFLGLDGANWPYVEELIADGQMPNFKKLLDNGTMGMIKTFNPPVSPPQWTSVATGKLPAKHGITNFVSSANGFSEYALVGSNDRHVKALWNIFEEKGYKVGLFGWTATYPVELKTGYTVTDIAVINPVKGIEPDSLRNGIIANTAKTLGFATFAQGVSLDIPDAQDINDAKYFEAAHKKFTLFNDLFNGNSLYAFNHEQPDILFQEDDVLDGTQHIFLKFKRPEEFEEPIEPALQEKYGDFVDEIYRAKDELLGKYMKLASPDTHIIVFSDSGFFVDPVSGWRFDKIDSILELLGFLKRDSSGNIDYSRTIAYECGNNNFDWERRLCINLEDRQERGIVAQKDFDRTVKQIISVFNSLKTTDGESIFKSVSETFSASGDVKYDIKRSVVDKSIILNNKEYPIKKFLTLSIESGAHYANPEGPPGFFIWSGPNIRKGNVIENMRYIDFAPNILYSLGYPIGKDMDGEYLQSMYVEPKMPEYIETYESNPNKLSSSNNEMLSGRDNEIISENKATIFDDIRETDKYKQFCFNLGNKNVAVQVDNIYKVNDPKAAITTAVNNDFESVDFIKIKKLTDLEQISTTVISPDEFNTEMSKENSFNVLGSLETNTPAEMGIWTNMSFTVQSPGKGVFRLIAKGTSVDGVFPTLEFSEGGKVFSRLDINSTDYHPFDVKIPMEGVINIAFVNDKYNDNEDRNIRIQMIKFSQTGMFEPEQDMDFFMQNDELCFYNRRKGTYRLEMSVIPQNIPSTGAEDKDIQKALEFLQTTGEIKDTSTESAP